MEPAARQSRFEAAWYTWIALHRVLEIEGCERLSASDLFESAPVNVAYEDVIEPVRTRQRIQYTFSSAWSRCPRTLISVLATPDSSRKANSSSLHDVGQMVKVSSPNFSGGLKPSVNTALQPLL